MSARAAVYISGTVGTYVSLGVHTAVIGDVCVRIAVQGQLLLCMSVHVLSVHGCLSCRSVSVVFSAHQQGGY